MSHLKAYQADHVDRVLEIFKTSHFAIDTSITGSGKTHASLALAQSLGVSVFVVCEATAKHTWRDVQEEFFPDVKIQDLMSYHLFRGVKNLVSHGYFEYNDDEVVLLHKFKKLVRRKGVMLIFDEAHGLRNPSKQTKISYFLSKYIREDFKRGGKSRVLFLSATPFNKEINACNVLRALGLHDGKPLVKGVPFYDNEPLVQLRRRLRAIDDEGYNKVVHFPAPTAAEAKREVYQMFNQIIKKKCSSTMLSRDKRDKLEYGVKHTKMNIVVKPHTEEESLSYKEGINMIKLLRVKKDGRALTNVARMTQIAKIAMLCKLAREELTINPSCKVILFTDYVEYCGQSIAKNLHDLNPLYLHGKVDHEERGEIIKKFNAPDLESRVLIATSSVGGSSISLHDTDGRFPRAMFILPSHHGIQMAQCMGRHCRNGVNSDCKTYIVFGPSPVELTFYETYWLTSSVINDTSGNYFGVQRNVRSVADFHEGKSYNIKDLYRI